MWLYPVPVIITLLIWLFLLYNNEYALWGGLFAVAGVGVYYLKKKFFEKAEQRAEP
jgi:hypothetical protein